MSEIGSQLNFEELSFRTAGINAFPDLRYPRVVILDLINEDKKVFELSQKINSSIGKIGYKSDKQFHPHITLARVKRDKKINLLELRNINIPDLTFMVSGFHLMESKLNNVSSEYNVVKEYKLNG